MANANLNTSGDAAEDNQHRQGGVHRGNGSLGYCEASLGSNWVTPDQNEIQDLINLGFVRGTHEGQSGWFFGTDNLNVATENANSYMFLPDN